MSTTTKSESQRAMELWNKHNKVGTPVRFRRGNGTWTDHQTTTEATLASGGRPAVIRLSGVDGVVPLSRVAVRRE